MIKTIKPADIFLRKDNYTLIDMRTPKEYETSHIVGSINIPIFSNEEHEEIGILYKKSHQDAKLLALKYGAENIKYIINNIIDLRKTTDTLIIYCARGGMRSSIICALLNEVKFANIIKIDGGYKAYRNYVIDKIDEIIDNKKIYVINGYSGVNKTGIIINLNLKNLPVINIEDLAKSPGSAFGWMVSDKQPSQKMFENNLLEKLMTINEDYFIIESNSRKIGKIHLPQTLYNKMTESQQIVIKTNMKNRIENIKNLYLNNNIPKSKIVDLLINMKYVLGKESMNRYLSMINEDNYDDLIEGLLVNHYDSLYEYSINKRGNIIKEIQFSNMSQTVKEIIDTIKE